MPRYEKFGDFGVFENRDAADERGEGYGVSENRQKILGERIVRVDDLADDRGGRRKQCDADRSEEENDRAGDHPRRVVAPQVDVAAVKKAKQGHYKRYGSEQYADSVIHMSCFNG